MLNTMLPRSVSTIALTVALSTGLSAQDIGAWDTDADGVLTEAEFGDGLDEAGLFDQWDSNEDTTLDHDEVLEGIFHIWDTSNNGELSVSEWDDAVDLWFGEADVNLAVENWDTDGNDVISPFEFMRVRGETTLLSRIGFDTPRDVLAREDLRDGLFGIVDADGDASIGEEGDIWLTDLFEMMNLGSDVAVDNDLGPVGIDDTTALGDDDSSDLIQDGEAFSHLPIPCGTDASGCEDIAERFCAALDYDPPLDFLEVDGSLFVIRCADNF